ncbi:MAG: hypothetical protein V4725_19900, partial [Bacteroidota bacterium]
SIAPFFIIRNPGNHLQPESLFQLAKSRINFNLLPANAPYKMKVADFVPKKVALKIIRSTIFPDS